MTIFENQTPAPLPSEAARFYRALFLCTKTQSPPPPHPVQARNCGMLPAWRDWVEKHEPTSGLRLTENCMTGPDRRFTENVDVCIDVILSHPVRLQGQPVQSRADIEATSILATAL